MNGNLFYYQKKDTKASLNLNLGDFNCSLIAKVDTDPSRLLPLIEKLTKSFVKVE